MASEDKPIQDYLSHPILLSETLYAAVDDADSFKLECSQVCRRVDLISQMLRTLVRFSAATPFLYEPPIRRVASDISNNLRRALTLVRKCKRQSIVRRVVTIVSAADFRKVLNFLEASIADMKWLLSIFDTAGAGGIVVSLPPIASNDPILSWVWSFIALIQMGELINDRIEAANELAALAQDNDRNKKIIVEEGGIPPLLKLLKESASPDGQIAAVSALIHLANDPERVRIIVNELAVPIIVPILGDSTMRVQIQAAKLLARMAENDPIAQEAFSRENAIRPLVTLLSYEISMDDYHKGQHSNKQSIHSIMQINRKMEGSNIRTWNHRKEWENEEPESKLDLKTSCAEALWMLAKGSESNSKKITETKGMLCLAKLLEKEKGDLQFNSLMTIMEITAAAESNADLRRAAFKTNSSAAKFVVEQLLRVIVESQDSPFLQIPAIKSIGSLARTFPARETRVIGPLVTQLSHKNPDVATEATIALNKFACPDNFLCVEHSKAIVEFNCVMALMRLLRGSEVTKLHGLVLLCYLSLHAGESEALEQARVLTTLEGADRNLITHNPELRELVSRAIYHINLYHDAGVHSKRILYLPKSSTILI